MGPSADAYGGRGPLVMGITWTEAILATICVAMRLWSATNLTKKAEWDLFWVVIAWLNSMVAQAFLSVSVAFGTGNHINNLTPHDIVLSQKWSWLGQIVAIFAIGYGKFAIIALLLRIQGPTTHIKKGYFLHFIWITNTILNIAQTVLILLQCTPVDKIWDISIPGSCDFRSTTTQTGFLQGSWAAASDAALAIYPVFVFWDLKLNWKRKIGLCALMGGGLIAAVAAACKTYNIHLIGATTDIAYAITPLILWAWTEQWLIIILGSVPQMRVVWNLMKDRQNTVKGTTNQSGSNSTYYRSHLNDSRGRPKRYDDTTSFVDDSAAHAATAERTQSETHILAPVSEIVVTNSYSVTYDSGSTPQTPDVHTEQEKSMESFMMQEEVDRNGTRWFDE